jgi:lysyl-tRNA synthetase class 1
VTRARYTFGSDDYDALDSLPLGLEDYYRPHLGRPLCNVPAPPDSAASDFAEHFIGEFFDLFHVLGLEAETYRMRDVYRSGEFDQAIDLALRNASVIRQAYLEASGSRKPDDWYPLQVICPQCAKIATTVVTGYDGALVTYTCRPALVDGAGGWRVNGADGTVRRGGEAAVESRVGRQVGLPRRHHRGRR